MLWMNNGKRVHLGLETQTRHRNRVVTTEKAGTVGREGRKGIEEKLLQGCGLQIGAQGRSMSTWGPGERRGTRTQAQPWARRKNGDSGSRGREKNPGLR